MHQPQSIESFLGQPRGISESEEHVHGMKQVPPIASERRLMIRAAQLYYDSEPRLEQRDIAERIGVSASKVSRLLRQAYEQGIVRITVALSHEVELEERLISTFGLKDAQVVIADEEINLKAAIGRTAAEYFQRIVSDGMRVGVGGGHTLYHMIDSLTKSQRRIEICPFFVARESALVDFMHPNVLVTLLWQRCENIALSYTLDIPPYEGTPEEIEREKERFLTRPRLQQVYQRMQAIDIGFTGIGVAESGAPFIRFAEQVGSSLADLQAKGAVGDISHFVFDNAGQEIDSLVGKATIGLGGQRIREMVQDPTKRLIAVAGGRTKIQPIYIALRYGLADTLVTDHNTAEGLLELAGSGR